MASIPSIAVGTLVLLALISSSVVAKPLDDYYDWSDGDGDFSPPSSPNNQTTTTTTMIRTPVHEAITTVFITFDVALTVIGYGILFISGAFVLSFLQTTFLMRLHQWRLRREAAIVNQSSSDEEPITTDADGTTVVNVRVGGTNQEVGSAGAPSARRRIITERTPLTSPDAVDQDTAVVQILYDNMSPTQATTTSSTNNNVNVATAASSTQNAEATATSVEMVGLVASNNNVSNEVNANNNLSANVANVALVTPISREEGYCVLCETQPINCVLLKCNHAVMCYTCARKTRDCPSCQSKIHRRMRLFVV